MGVVSRRIVIPHRDFLDKSARATVGSRFAGYRAVMLAAAPGSRCQAMVSIALVGAVVWAAAGCGPQQSEQAQSPQPQSSQSQTPPSPPSLVDWSAVQQALGAPLETEEGVHHVEIPRTDLHVMVGDVSLQPGMELDADLNFLPSGADNAVLVGELTVLDAEQQPVIDALQRGGLSIAAVHKHIPAQSPDIWWVHFVGYGQAQSEAAAVHRALAATTIPLPPSSSEQQPPPGLDVAALDAALGSHGEIQDGAYKTSLAVREQISDTRAHVVLPPPMEAQSMVMFQSLPGNQAVANGDIAMTADQVNPVTSVLLQNNIHVVSLHNHMLYEQPRLFYLHYWATGDALTLARGLRLALNHM